VASDNYDALHRGFRWPQLREFNWFEACCARWARQTPQACALICENERGDVTRFTYADLCGEALRLAAALAALGVARGDRVAVVMPQRFETAVAQMALSALGAVAMPLSMLFGPEALAYRLRDSEAVLAIVDESAIDNLLAVRAAGAYGFVMSSNYNSRPRACEVVVDGERVHLAFTISASPQSQIEDVRAGGGHHGA